MTRLLLSIFIFLFFVKASMAQVLDSIHYSWEVFELEESTDLELEPIKRCYVMSPPKSSKTNYTGDRGAYLSISRFESERTEEASIVAGFEYKGHSKIYALIGKKDFPFFTRGDSAWLNSSRKDKKFIQEMLRNDFVRVRSDSAFGSYAVDEYSLKGFARAYKRMKALCP
jgi:hypothetical protein